MAKRPNPMRLRAARSYSVIELADALDVSVGTVRRYVRRGMPVMKAKRPALILGEDAKDFLTAMKNKAKRPLAPNELYCLTCKEPRRPFGDLVDLYCQEGRTARISGLCEVCENLCNRVVSEEQIAQLSEFFDVSTRTT